LQNNVHAETKQNKDTPANARFRQHGDFNGGKYQERAKQMTDHTLDIRAMQL
jgi:hypothetical protein